MEKLRKKAQYQLTYGNSCFCCFACEKTLSRLLDKINYHRAHREHREGGLMNYLVNPDISEEIDERETDPLTGNSIGASIDVHRALGPGLLESAYEACLVYELRLRRLKVEAQKPL